jgi:hypothetical protein
MAPQTLTKKESCTVLGITYPTTRRDAKVAFMKLMREHHEDKGGVKEKNQLVSLCWRAHEVRWGELKLTDFADQRSLGGAQRQDHRR